MAKNRQIRNDSFVFFSLDELLPQDHLVRDSENGSVFPAKGKMER